MSEWKIDYQRGYPLLKEDNQKKKTQKLSWPKKEDSLKVKTNEDDFKNEHYPKN